MLACRESREPSDEPNIREPMTPTVLLVEDNEDNRTIYMDVLEHAGYHVVTAPNGEEGVHLACELHPDLILMDIGMPVIDGYLAARLLRADPCTRSIPIVAVTAHAMEGDREQALAGGFDGYVPKPATPREVLHEVQRRLGPPSSP